MHKAPGPAPGETERLKDVAKNVRRDILLMCAEAAGGHYMSSFSSVEILVSLFFTELRFDPKNPADPGRDRFVLSKGHAAPALYAVMAESGYFPREELKTLRKCGSRLQGHPVMSRLPGLNSSSGSLGQGISTAVGIALAGKMDKKDYRTYVLLGDGECQEGLVWEAAMAAAHFQLENLVAIVDRNRLQISGTTDQVMSLGDLRAKWHAFGWEVIAADGHDITSMIAALRKARDVRGKPACLIADTVKGRGIPFIENNLKYHTAPLNEDEMAKAMKCLE